MDDHSLSSVSSDARSRSKFWFPLALVLIVAICLTAAHAIVMQVRQEQTRLKESRPCPRPSRFVPAFEISYFPGMTWTADLEVALDVAWQTDSLVFLDVTAVTDSNAALNHRVMSENPEVRRALQKYQRALMYTDWVPRNAYLQPPSDEERQADAETNRSLQEKQFETVEEPMYAILKPTANGGFEVVEVFREGQLQDMKRFLRFLQRPGRDPKNSWWPFSP